ncbi:MAG TPA: glycosyltransferase [Chlamydiales bacterium]|nr:glycosyltransferase [Chlamydiales bacterium]
MNEVSSPLFSVVVIASRFYHLIPATIDSIKRQTNQNFEIILIETGITKHDMQIIKEYIPKIGHFGSLSDVSVTEMINEGLQCARGRYVHFLEPGDIYLSKHSMEILSTHIKKSNFPQLIWCSYLDRMNRKLPEVVKTNFSKESLMTGRVPPYFLSSWYDRQLLLSMHGVQTKYQYRFGYDLMCQLFVEKKPSFLFINQVLTDYYLKPNKAQDNYVIFKETLMVIRKYFGFFQMLKELFFLNKIYVLKSLLYGLKKSLIKS